ncbi:hypothetical protein BI49514_02979 [Brevibacterium iodinum ATCC 49514]|uniref:Uncharacterized protein n=1 Tax=Brevibacterium iodinum ATCC 49514 TaxID=1255616 RepID=A0A2H1KEK2_9MICO|nr:hypothetical protein BI49514_02979 [Brevibacterium iodinum ATCC 49514]SUW13268.1 Uncharacterised protein [Brevibacterium iodinum]
MKKCRALGCKLATDFVVGVPRIIHVSSKANQHVQSEMVIRESSCFTAVQVSPGVCRSAVSDAHREGDYDTACRD